MDSNDNVVRVSTDGEHITFSLYDGTTSKVRLSPDEAAYIHKALGSLLRHVRTKKAPK